LLAPLSLQRLDLADGILHAVIRAPTSHRQALCRHLRGPNIAALGTTTFLW
jgi:hypothetical protein